MERRGDGRGWGVFKDVVCVGPPCSSAWSHTHGYMGSWNWTRWVMEIKKLEMRRSGCRSGRMGMNSHQHFCKYVWYSWIIINFKKEKAVSPWDEENFGVLCFVILNINFRNYHRNTDYLTNAKYKIQYGEINRKKQHKVIGKVNYRKVSNMKKGHIFISMRWT